MSHFVVLDEPYAIDQLYARVSVSCALRSEGELVSGYEEPFVCRVVDVRNRAEKIPHVMGRDLARHELLALDVVLLVVFVCNDIDTAVVCPADDLGSVA